GASTFAFILCGWLTFGRWANARLRARQGVLSRLAQGDLTATSRSGHEGPADVQRLILSLRRAFSQVQRVTSNLHRTGEALAEQSGSLLEAARRQGSAVDRTLSAVGDMGSSLSVSGRRVAQLDAFAQETTAALSEMTQRIQHVAEPLSTLTTFATATNAALSEMTRRSQQVAEALSTPTPFALENAAQVPAMGERLGAISAGGDALLRFATETDEFVSSVEGSIDLVRRRAHETGQLALQVRHTAEAGEAQVRDSVQGIYRLEASVRGVADLVEVVGQRGKEIARVVDVIQDVSDRTHLLALNASIIAAQAGEHGRAFGVVAEEIRGLAERTGGSAREVRSMVTALRSSVNSAVALVQDSHEQARIGVALGD